MAYHLPLWKQVLRQNFVDVTKLADFLELTEDQKSHLILRPRFVLNLPKRLAEKIEKGTLEDPLLKQFLPINEENSVSSCFSNDPIGDVKSRKAPKLLHKYEGRVLLLCTSACAMHCRYCFRRHFDYEVSKKVFGEELEIIRNDPSIREVILSGGDPLSLDDKVIEELVVELSLIPHVRKLRFHSRFLVGIPERIDENFIKILSSTSLQVIFVVHINHPREVDEDVLLAIRKLQRLGIPVLNQFVLLRGVNDSLEILEELCHLMTDYGIMPYYMHQLDRVQGAQHFEIEEEEGKKLIAALSKILPGYAVPKYVREIAGEPSKTPIVFTTSNFCH